VTEHSRLAAAWLKAGGILGFEVVAPYSVTLASGARILASALVKGFGATNGMLILTDYFQVRSELAALQEAGYGFSVLEEPEATDPFDVEEYAEMLRDWGWAGDEEDKPSWFSML
jgi:hypothetical protein